MKAKKIVIRFDKPEMVGFDESDISIALAEIPEAERQVFENKAEWMAFAFSEGGCDEWNTYYGPRFVRNDGICVPSKEEVSNEFLIYWKTRLDESTNPILKARYSGLYVDFSPISDRSVRNLHLQSLLEAVNGKYPKYATNSVNKLKRAFQIAITSKDSESIAAVKKCLQDFDIKYAKDNDVGIWGRCFLIVYENAKSFSIEEHASYVNRIEQRISRLYEKPLDGEGENRFNAFAISEGVELLAKYYRKHNDNENLTRVLKIMDSAFHKEFPKLSGLQKYGLLDRLYRTYHNYHLFAEAEVVLAELQKTSKTVSEEMSKIDIPYNIPKAQLDAYIDDMTSGSFDDVMGKFIFQYIPNKTEFQSQLLEIRKNHPLFTSLSTSIFDSTGRPSSVIGSFENDLEGNLVRQVSQGLSISHIFMHSVLDRLIKDNVFTAQTISGFIANSPFFGKDRIPIIEQGLIAFFDQNHVVSIHLLIPQIENAIRNIIEASGASTIKLQKNNRGYQLKTLDELLRDSDFVFEEDFSFYLRVLFTDQRGWNLRNIVSHGLSPHTFFNQMTADRVLHSLLCVSAIRLVKKDE